jgi:hypothetical protein
MGAHDRGNREIQIVVLTGKCPGGGNNEITGDTGIPNGDVVSKSAKKRP